MSVFPVQTTSLPTDQPPQGQMGGIVCYERICPTEEIQIMDIDVYSTTLIKAMETLMSSAVLFTNTVLFLILVVAHKRFTTAFFRILNVLVLVIIIRTLTTIIFKLPSLWFRAVITDGTTISLIVDVLSKYLCIILVFLLSLNRFTVMIYPALDQVLFSGRRYIFLCVICVVASAAVTYGVITASNLRRFFEPKIGFVDYIDSAASYEVSCAAFLFIATASVCLHLIIMFHIRFYRKQMTTVKPNKVEKKMFREITMISVINMSFTILFVLLYILPSSYNTRVVVISVYNILCSIPDVLIPLSVLIGSREVRLELSARYRTMIPRAKFRDSSIIKVSIKS